MLFYDLCSQWNIAGDDQVTGFHTLDDFVVRNIESRHHLDRSNVSQRWRAQCLIRDKGDQHAGSLRGSIEYLLNNNRAGIRVNPNVHHRLFLVVFRRQRQSDLTGLVPSVHQFKSHARLFLKAFDQGVTHGGRGRPESAFDTQGILCQTDSAFTQHL